MKIYRGYEFIKAIQENKIKSNTKFKATSEDGVLSTIVRFDGVDIVYYDNNENIFNDWFLIRILNSTFTEIEENEEIKELDNMELINAKPKVNERKINEIVRAVNKINKQLEEQETEDIDTVERGLNKMFKEREEK